MSQENIDSVIFANPEWDVSVDPKEPILYLSTSKGMLTVPTDPDSAERVRQAFKSS